MIRTKSVYDLADKSDGDRILVSRYWPRGISKVRLKLTEWLKLLAPSKDLLSDWKMNTITWHDYVHRYHSEMESNSELIKTLAIRVRKTTILIPLQFSTNNRFIETAAAFQSNF